MYVHIVYVRIYIYIYRYVPIVGGLGGPLQDKFWAYFGANKLGQKNSDQKQELKRNRQAGHLEDGRRQDPFHCCRRTIYLEKDRSRYAELPCILCYPESKTVEKCQVASALT